jgi:hypothetical protein
MDEVVVDGNADADAMDADAVSELDLVEELRFFADATDADGVMVTMLSGRTFTDAADEIERLRSLIAAWDDAPLDDRTLSDIVGRLRDAERYGQFGRSLLHRQVADEIERLRSEVDVLRVCYDELVLRVDHVDVDGTPSDPFVPVLLAPWVVDVLTDPHASMHQERVESIWLSVVESCERAKGLMF